MKKRKTIFPVCVVSVGILAILILFSVIRNTVPDKNYSGEFADSFTVVVNDREYNEKRNCPDGWFLDFSTYEKSEQRIKVKNKSLFSGTSILYKAPDDINEYILYTSDMFGDVLYFSEDIVYPGFSQAAEIRITYFEPDSTDAKTYKTDESKIITDLCNVVENNEELTLYLSDELGLSCAEASELYFYFDGFPMSYCKKFVV